jgi:hypothetical protein
MEDTSKRLCYKLFKENFEFEPYLDILTYKNIKTESQFVNKISLALPDITETTIIFTLSNQEDWY